MVVDDRDENVGNASRRPEQSTAFTAARSAAAAANLPARQGSRDHCLRRCVYCRRRDIARHRLNNKTLLYPTSIYICIYIFMYIGTSTLDYRQNILKRKIWFKTNVGRDRGRSPLRNGAMGELVDFSVGLLGIDTE